MLLLLLHFALCALHSLELERPAYVVQELAQIEAIVVRRIVLGVIRGCQRRHLVPIDGVLREEVLHLHTMTTAVTATTDDRAAEATAREEDHVAAAATENQAAM